MEPQNKIKKVIKYLHIKKGWLWHLLLITVLRHCRPKSTILNKEDDIWLWNSYTDFWTVRKTNTCKFTKLPHVTFTHHFSEKIITGYCELYSQHFFISTLNLTSQTWNHLFKHLKFPSVSNSNSLIWVKISWRDGSGNYQSNMFWNWDKVACLLQTEFMQLRVMLQRLKVSSVHG